MVYKFKEYKKSDIMRNHLNMGSSGEREKIDVTSLYFERGGNPWLPIMGEYHFSRDKRENWYTELCKMKAGGVGIVATYLFWIHHEEVEGQFDFSGNLDIRQFVLDARKAGLDVIIRIGPWCHGETRNGGFPDWLLKKDFKLRDNNPGYMEKAKLWYAKIYDEVKGLFYKDGGNIIGVQFENELVNNPEHIFELKKAALEIGYDAPLYTVTGWNSMYGAKIPVDEVVPVFAAYADAPWAGHTKPLPPSAHYAFYTTRNDSAVGLDIIDKTDSDNWVLPYEKYPFATCELGGGIHPTYHRRYIYKGMDAYAMSLVKLGAGNNLVGYYMYHGGVNPIGKNSTLNESKETGYPNDYPVLNYDYQTALSGYGEAREQYGLMNMLHMFINDFGDLLAPMECVMAENFVPQTDFENLRYCMRTDGESGFIFVNNYQRREKLSRHDAVVFNTGNVTFPEITVENAVSFILPFNLKMGDYVLEYATAQLLSESNGTYFFCRIPSIEPEFMIDGNRFTGRGFTYKGIRVVLVDFEDAKFLRKLNGKIYIGDGCNLYFENNRLKAIENGDFSYREWNGEEFEAYETESDFKDANVMFETCDEPFVPPYEKELHIGGGNKRSWKRIYADSPNGFIEVLYPCDVAQIYANGELVADNYYCGLAWRVPARLVYQKESYLVMSNINEEIYKEF